MEACCDFSPHLLKCMLRITSHGCFAIITLFLQESFDSNAFIMFEINLTVYSISLWPILVVQSFNGVGIIIEIIHDALEACVVLGGEELLEFSWTNLLFVV